jgi:hypothetical protein
MFLLAYSSLFLLQRGIGSKLADYVASMAKRPEVRKTPVRPTGVE